MKRTVQYVTLTMTAIWAVIFVGVAIVFGINAFQAADTTTLLLNTAGVVVSLACAGIITAIFLFRWKGRLFVGRSEQVGKPLNRLPSHTQPEGEEGSTEDSSSETEG